MSPSVAPPERGWRSMMMRPPYRRPTGRLAPTLGALSTWRDRCASLPARSSVLTQLAGARHRIPFDKRPRPKHTVVKSAQQMSADSEEILYDAMDGRKELKMGG